MPTTITRYLDTGATGADDGTSIGDAYPDWVTALNDIESDYANFVTSDVVVELLCTGGLDSTSSTMDFGSTCDATRYLHIKPYQSGDRNLTGEWSTSYYTAEVTHNAGVLLRVSSGAKVVIDQINIADGKTNSTSNAKCFDVNGGTLELNKVWMKMTGTIDSTPSGNDLDVAVYGRGSPTITLNDCVIEGFNQALRKNTTGGTIKLTNVLIKDNQEGIALIQSGTTTTAKNCLFSGNTTDIDAFGETLAGGSNYNFTDSSTTPTNWGANSGVEQTITFVSSTDYRLNASATALHSAGVGTTDSDVASEDKIDVARTVSTASPGPFEYASSGGGNTFNPFGGMINSLGIGLIQ